MAADAGFTAKPLLARILFTKRLTHSSRALQYNSSSSEEIILRGTARALHSMNMTASRQQQGTVSSYQNGSLLQRNLRQPSFDIEDRRRKSPGGAGRGSFAHGEFSGFFPVVEMAI